MEILTWNNYGIMGNQRLEFMGWYLATDLVNSLFVGSPCLMSDEFLHF